MMKVSYHFVTLVRLIAVSALYIAVFDQPVYKIHSSPGDACAKIFDFLGEPRIGTLKIKTVPERTAPPRSAGVRHETAP